MASIDVLTDSELISLIKTDSESAFKELFFRYDALLYSYAYRKLQDRQEAQDIVQDVFIKLWNTRHAFEIKSSLQGYFYKSTLNMVLDVFKHRKVRVAYADQFIEVDSSETDYLIREHEIYALIDREIANMPPRMREIYELKRKHFLSAKEIAEQLDISEHTVNTQIKRALKYLRMKLGLLIYILYILH